MISNSTIEELTPEQIAFIREVWKIDYEMSRQDAESRLQFQIDFAQSLLKNLILVNGGAIVALFTVLGISGIKVNSDYIWLAFAFFSTGVSSVLVAYFGAFFSQKYFMETSSYEAWNAQHRLIGQEPPYELLSSFRKGNISFAFGVGFATISLMAFIGGASFALSGVL